MLLSCLEAPKINF